MQKREGFSKTGVDSRTSLIGPQQTRCLNSERSKDSGKHEEIVILNKHGKQALLALLDLLSHSSWFPLMLSSDDQICLAHHFKSWKLLLHLRGPILKQQLTSAIIHWMCISEKTSTHPRTFMFSRVSLCVFVTVGWWQMMHVIEVTKNK